MKKISFSYAVVILIVFPTAYSRTLGKTSTKSSSDNIVFSENDDNTGKASSTVKATSGEAKSNVEKIGLPSSTSHANTTTSDNELTVFPGSDKYSSSVHEINKTTREESIIDRLYNNDPISTVSTKLSTTDDSDMFFPDSTEDLAAAQPTVKISTEKLVTENQIPTSVPRSSTSVEVSTTEVDICHSKEPLVVIQSSGCRSTTEATIAGHHMRMGVENGALANSFSKGSENPSEQNPSTVKPKTKPFVDIDDKFLSDAPLQDCSPGYERNEENECRKLD